MTPPSSIEEVAKRVKELAEGGGLLGVDRRTGEEYDLRDLAPQLAEWVEKALPVIEAARAFRDLGNASPADHRAARCTTDEVGCMEEWYACRLAADRMDALVAAINAASPPR